MGLGDRNSVARRNDKYSVITAIQYRKPQDAKERHAGNPDRPPLCSAIDKPAQSKDNPQNLPGVETVNSKHPANANQKKHSEYDICRAKECGGAGANHLVGRV